MRRTAPPIADRINKLFETIHSAEFPEQTSAEVANAVAAATGRPVSGNCIDNLRRARQVDQHDLPVLAALAEYFDAPRSYLAAQWDDEAQQYDQEMTLLAQIRDNGVQMLAMRDGGSASTNELVQILQQLPREKTR